MTNFNEAKERNFEKLEQYVPVVDRVHGAHHPEFHNVRSLYEQIKAKIDKAGASKPELDSEFKQLREITKDYEVPGDVCESYAAVYNMLEDLDKSYQA